MWLAVELVPLTGGPSWKSNVYVTARDEPLPSQLTVSSVCVQVMEATGSGGVGVGVGGGDGVGAGGA